MNEKLIIINNKTLIKCILLISIAVGLSILLISIQGCFAYSDMGDNLIEPRYYDGNLLIFNEGNVPYSVHCSDDNGFLGVIDSNEGMYINESLNYTLSAMYDDLSDYRTVDVVEKKINQWWFVVTLLGILVFVILGIYKVIK